MKSSLFNAANMVASKVLAEVQAVQAQVLQALEAIPDNENAPTQPSLNSATDDIQRGMLKLLQSMQAEIKELKE